MVPPVLRVDETGEGDRAAAPYLRELGIALEVVPQPIKFSRNKRAPVHRWSPYVQGFSAEFVRATLTKHWDEYRLDRRDSASVHDPFAGSGTVLVEAKHLGARHCSGSELNPLLAFLANVKIGHWEFPPRLLIETLMDLDRAATYPAPDFLQTERQFAPEVLDNLCAVRGAIEGLAEGTIKDFFKLAFAAILVDCSRLHRSPCLGYSPNKQVSPHAPWQLLSEKIRQIAGDLAELQQAPAATFRNNDFAQVALADARRLITAPVALAITSPPYMNGLDYVTNYKIEMGWLGFTGSRRDAKTLKDSMVACDNVSLSVTEDFAGRPVKYVDPWLEEIVSRLAANIGGWNESRRAARIPRRRKESEQRATERFPYRRRDMPLIVHKYFDDVYQVMAKVTSTLIPGGRFVLVVGDSFIADVYVPTDLMLAKMGRQLGLAVESVVKARERRSGQIRSYRLRETVVTLRK